MVASDWEREWEEFYKQLAEQDARYAAINQAIKRDADHASSWRSGHAGGAGCLLPILTCALAAAAAVVVVVSPRPEVLVAATGVLAYLARHIHHDWRRDKPWRRWRRGLHERLQPPPAGEPTLYRRNP